MHLQSALALAATILAPAALATPLPKSEPVGLSSQAWKVNYSALCGTSPEGCGYELTITSPNTPRIAGFNTTCTGTNVEQKAQPCNDPSVYVLEFIPRSGDEYLKVRHRYFYDECKHTTIGYHVFRNSSQAYAMGVEFTIRPNETSHEGFGCPH